MSDYQQALRLAASLHKQAQIDRSLTSRSWERFAKKSGVSASDAALAGASAVPLGLGATTGASALQALADTLRDYRRGVKELAGGVALRAGDVILMADPAELAETGTGSKLWKALSGHPGRQHSLVVMPSREGPRVLGPLRTEFGRQNRFPVLTHLLGTWKKGKTPSLEKAWRFAQRQRESAGQTAAKSPQEIAEWLAKGRGAGIDRAPSGPMLGRGYAEIYRPRQPLSQEDIGKMLHNLSKTVRQSTTYADSLVSGVGRVVAPRVPWGGQRSLAGNCAGGVCKVYEGVRSLGRPGQVLPSDLAHAKDLQYVGSMGTVPEAMRGMRASALRHGLAGAGLRSAIALPMLGLGALGMSRALSGPETSDVVKKMQQQVA